jgi:hypothetical protein
MSFSYSMYSQFNYLAGLLGPTIFRRTETAVRAPNFLPLLSCSVMAAMLQHAATHAHFIAQWPLMQALPPGSCRSSKDGKH